MTAPESIAVLTSDVPPGHELEVELLAAEDAETSNLPFGFLNQYKMGGASHAPPRPGFLRFT